MKKLNETLPTIEELHEEYKKVSNQKSDLKDKISEVFRLTFINDHFPNSTWEFNEQYSSGQITFKSNFKNNKFNFLEDEIRLGHGDKVWRHLDYLILSVNTIKRLAEYVQKYKLKLTISDLNKMKLENNLKSIQEILKLCK